MIRSVTIVILAALCLTLPSTGAGAEILCGVPPPVEDPAQILPRSSTEAPAGPQGYVDRSTDLTAQARLADNSEEQIKLLRQSEAVLLGGLEQNPDSTLILGTLAYTRLVLGDQLPKEQRQAMYAAADQAAEKTLRIYQRTPNDLDLRRNEWQVWYTRGDALQSQAKLVEGEHKIPLLQSSCAFFRTASKLEPNSARPLTAWATSLDMWAHAAPRSEKRRLFALAIDKVQQAARLDPENLYLQHEQAGLWIEAADEAPPRERRVMYEKAAALSAVVVTKNPQEKEFLLTYGVALNRLAAMEEQPEKSKDLLRQTLAKDQDALYLDPLYPPSIGNFAYDASALAKHSSRAEKAALRERLGLLLNTLELFGVNDGNVSQAMLRATATYAVLSEDHTERRAGLQKAVAYAEKAQAAGVENEDLLGDWGWVLMQLAKVSPQEEKEQLLAASGEKYAQIQRMNPENAYSHIAQAYLLIQRAALRQQTGATPELVHADLTEAGLRLQDYYALNHHETNHYIEVALAALRGQKKTAQRKLATAEKQNKLPDCEAMQEDAEFDNIRNEPWFQDTISRACADY